jgi:hypothetical protein
VVARRVAPPGRRSIAARMLAAGVLLCLGRASAIVLDDPDHFQVKGTWSATDLGVPPPLGGLAFSADGGTLYVVGDADEAGSGLYAVPVVRDNAGQVTDLGSGVLAFGGSAGLDAGLERGPAGTLFYSYIRTNQLGQRPGGVGGAESVFDLGAHGVPAAISGLTFSPVRIDPGTGFGRLQISTTFGSELLEVPLVAAGGGAFQPHAASVFVTLPLGSVAGLQYVPAGTFAGDLLYANFDEGQLRVLAIDAASGLPIDAQSGEPALGTASPVERGFATDLGVGPLGLEFDARTGDDLFVTTFGGNPADTLIQIGGFAGTFATTTTSTTSSTSLTTEPPPTSTSATTASTALTTTSATSTVPSTAPSTSSTVVSTSTSTLPTSTLPPTSSTTTTSPTTSSASTLPASTTSSSVSATSSTSAPSSSTSSSVTTSTAGPSSSTSTTTSATSTTAPDASTTTIASTSSSSLAPATSTSTSTSTVSSLPGTTSTLPPVITPTTTIPSACTHVPTFASVRCRLAGLARRVDESRLVVGPLEAPLVRRVRRAERRARAADERAGAGRMRRARQLVARVAVELRAFEAALASRRGQAVPASLRTELAGMAGALRVDVRALRAAL